MRQGCWNQSLRSSRLRHRSRPRPYTNYLRDSFTTVLSPCLPKILLRAHEREVSSNNQNPREGHYCHPGAHKLGLGVTEPFLEQTWQCGTN